MSAFPLLLKDLPFLRDLAVSRSLFLVDEDRVTLLKGSMILVLNTQKETEESISFLFSSSYSS